MQAFTWNEVAGAFGVSFRDELEAAYQGKLRGREKHSAVSGSMRHHLRYLITQSDPQSSLVREYFRRGRCVATDGAIVEALQATGYNWLGSEEVQKWSQNTRYHYTRNLCQSWVNLHDRYPEKYTSVPPDLVKTHEGTDTHESLGDQDWAELRGLTGAAREGRALRIVQSEAVAQFIELETLFWFGESIRTGEKIPAHADHMARSVIHERLSMLQPQTRRPAAEKFEMPKRLSLTDVGLWRAAGLDSSVSLPETLTGSAAQKLLKFATGPTVQMNLALAKIYSSETGWNRQPTFDIIRKPFEITETCYGVVTAAFLNSFKKRASHEVIGYLERGVRLQPLAGENFLAALRGAAREFPKVEEGGFEELGVGSNALQLMERFSDISERCRHFDVGHICDDNFFVYIRKDGVLVPASTCEHAPGRYQNVKRCGVDFPAIRRTYLFLKKREVGSFFGTTVMASQSNEATLRPHYFNDDETTEDFKRSIRLPQNVMEAVILEDKPDIALILNMDADRLQWYIQISKICGLRAALLPYNTEEFAVTKKITIHPTDSYLRSVHLIHMALTVFRFSNRNPLRWKLQGRPLTALAIAIKLELKSNGLEAALKKNAKEANTSVREGKSKLPIILTH
jgi:hypothetical protein